MADEKNIQAPSGAVTVESSEPSIFVMPEAYRDGKRSMVAPKPTVAAPMPPPAVAKPIPPAPVKPAPVPSHGGRKVILLIGLVLLLSLSVGGYFLLRTGEFSMPGAPTPVAPTPATPTTPTPTPTTPVPTTPTPTTPVSPFPGAIHPGTDMDSDGLSDLEETLIYGTDPRMPDTDGDGFLDGNEVFHRYNPAGTAPGTLLESGLVKRHANTLPAFFVLYPSVWDVATDNEAADVEFHATTGERVIVSTIAKDAGQSISDWKAQQDPSRTMFASTTKNGFSALSSEDQLAWYVDLGATVLSVRYDAGSKGSVDYLQTFKMLINSIAFDSQPPVL